MGTHMNIADIQGILIETMQRYAHIAKRAEHGQLLVTTQDGSHEDVMEIIAALTGDLSQQQAQRLVWMVDVMAVAEPDNVQQLWNPSALETASDLRRRYAKTYGESAYA